MCKESEEWLQCPVGDIRAITLEPFMALMSTKCCFQRLQCLLHFLPKPLGQFVFAIYTADKDP